MSNNDTVLESHWVTGHGSILDFIKESKGYGEWTCTDETLMKYLKRTAACDDEGGRKLAVELTNLVERLMGDGKELRKRFDTTNKALEKVNKGLKEYQDANK